jgi:hypothetical protein
MISILPEIYPNEIIFSFFMRYHILSGNRTWLHTSNDLFGNRYIVPNLYYPTHLEYFCSQTPNELHFTPENIINNMTIFPFFKPFIPDERAQKTIEKMKYADSSGLVSAMGFHPRSIFAYSEKIIKICPKCLHEDRNKYGEAYIHRNHQVPGNFVCYNHKIPLVEYVIKSNLNNYIGFNIDLINIESIEKIDFEANLMESFVDLAEDINLLLKGVLQDYNIHKVREKYWSKLQEKGYLISSNVNRKRLTNDLNSYYEKNFLLMIESDIYENVKWLRQMLNNITETVHPIRHLLLIRFLFGGVKEFADYNADFGVRLYSYLNKDANYNSENNPFGVGPYPCLNPIANHFKKPVINQCEIKRKNSKIIGIFKCSCGFVYSRDIPDKSNDSKFKYNKILQFGEVWENKLKEIICSSNYNVTRITKEMKCSNTSIVKYANKMGLIDNLNTKLRLKHKKRKTLADEDYENYKNDILQYISENKNATRSHIQKVLSKQIGLIRRREKEWLKTVLPKPNTSSFSVNYKDKNVDWEQKDIETEIAVKNAIDEILHEEKPKRITRALIAKKTNNIALLKKYIVGRLPKTEELLLKYCETVDEFKKRKDKKT